MQTQERNAKISRNRNYKNGDSQSPKIIFQSASGYRRPRPIDQNLTPSKAFNNRGGQSPLSGALARMRITDIKKF